MRVEQWCFLTPRNYLGLALLMLVFGCGGGDGSGTSSSADGGVTDGTGSDSGTASDGGEGADSGTLIMRCINDEMCPEDKYCRMGENRNQSVCALGVAKVIVGLDKFAKLSAVCAFATRVAMPTMIVSAASTALTGPAERGCRVGNADDCPFDEMGRPRTCDPATHTCELQVVCCDALDQCSLQLPDDCDEPLLDERGCFQSKSVYTPVRSRRGLRKRVLLRR